MTVKMKASVIQRRKRRENNVVILAVEEDRDGTLKERNCTIHCVRECANSEKTRVQERP